MAIVKTTPEAKVGFLVNATSADASDCEELVAAEAGKRIKVRHVTFNNLTAGALDFILGEGETADDPTTNLIGPVSVGANSTLQWDFNPLMELAVGTSLTFEAESGNVCVFAQGFIQ